ncbi:MAG: O-antigen ligase family protein [Thermodesulfovibrionales bacterium]
MNTIADIIKISKLHFYKNCIWITVCVFFVIIISVTIALENFLCVGLLLSPILIYLSIKKPFIFPFGAYVFLLPFDQLLALANTAGGPTLTKFLGVLTIFVLILKGSFEKKINLPDRIVIWWIFFVLYGTFSILWAIQPTLVLSRIPTAIGLLILYLLATSYKIQENEFDMLKWCIVGGGIISSVLIIYNFRSLATIERVTIQFGERAAELNQLPFDLFIPVALCIEKIFNARKSLVKVMFIFFLSMIVFAIILTGSRGGFIGVGIIFIVYIISLKRKLSMRIILVIIGIILLSLTPSFFIERFKEASETGGSGRIFIWSNAFKALRNYWIIGAGLNNFSQAYGECGHFTPFSSIYRGSHNIYLGIFVELGIIGFSVLILGIRKHYQIIKLRITHHDNNTVMLKASFWAMLVASFFLDTFWYKSFWLLWMMIMMHHNIMKRKNEFNFETSDIKTFNYKFE